MMNTAVKSRTCEYRRVDTDFCQSDGFCKSLRAYSFNRSCERSYTSTSGNFRDRIHDRVCDGTYEALRQRAAAGDNALADAAKSYVGKNQGRCLRFVWRGECGVDVRPSVHNARKRVSQEGVQDWIVLSIYADYPCDAELVRGLLGTDQGTS